MTPLARIADRAENSIMQTISIAVSAILIAAGLVTAPSLIVSARDGLAQTDLANVAAAEAAAMAEAGSAQVYDNATQSARGLEDRGATGIRFLPSAGVRIVVDISDDGREWLATARADGSSNVWVRSSRSAATLSSADATAALGAFGIVLASAPLPAGIPAAQRLAEITALGGAGVCAQGDYDFTHAGWATGSDAAYARSVSAVAALPGYLAVPKPKLGYTPASSYTCGGVTAAAQLRPTIATTALPPAVAGSPYTAAVVATGSPAPTLSSTTLPDGLRISDAGVITGTPTTGGTYNVTLIAKNASSPAGVAATVPLTVSSSAPVFAPLTGGAVTNTVGSAITAVNFSASGAPTPTLSSTSTLPTGVSLTFSGATAVLAGTVDSSVTAGTYPVVVRATSTAGVADQPYSLVIRYAPLAAPANVRTTRIFGTTATVAWDAVAGASSYTVTYGGASSGTTTTTATSLQRTLAIGSDINTTTVAVVASGSRRSDSDAGAGTVRMPASAATGRALVPTCTASYASDANVNADCALTSADGGWTSVMQGDGNFVTYRNNLSTGAVTPFFATGTSIANSTLSVQTDGNLVLYKPGGGGAISATNTYGSGTAVLTQGGDGALTLTRASDGGGTWRSLANPYGSSNTSFMDYRGGSNVTIDNAGAESDTAGNTRWGTYYGPTAGFTTEDKRFGARSWKIATTGGNYEGFIDGVNLGVSAGDRILVAMWVKGSAGESWAIAGRVENPYYEGMGGYTFTTDGSWQLVTVVYTAPYSSTQVNMQMRQVSKNAGKVLYSDGMSVYRGYPG